MTQSFVEQRPPLGGGGSQLKEKSLTSWTSWMNLKTRELASRGGG